MFILRTYANEESEVKASAGNGLLEICELVIVYSEGGGGYTATCKGKEASK